MLVSITPIVSAQPAVDPDAAAQTMVQSEMKFSQTSAERGIRESFLQFFADNSIILSPGPENGKQHYTAYQDKGYKLTWTPVFAAMAASADMGITTGPWEIRKSAADKTPLGYGQFFTVWKKQPDNSWKVAFDTGIENPQPTFPPGVVVILPTPETHPVDSATEKGALENAGKEFAKALKADAAAAVLAFASENIRVLRDDTSPATNKAAVKIMLSRSHEQVQREMSGNGMSSSGDLAYQYGSYESQRGLVTERGHYVTVWRAEPNGQWKILVDLQKKDPEPKK